MALRLPDFHSVKGTGDNDFGAQGDSRVGTQLFVNVHSTLSVNGDFHSVRSQGTSLFLAHLARTNFLQHLSNIALEGLSGHDVNALVASKREVTAGL